MTPAQILAHYGLTPASLAEFTSATTVIYSAPTLVWSYLPHDLKQKVYTWARRLVKNAPIAITKVLPVVEGLPWNKKLGLSLITVAIGAFFAFYWPMVSLEANYWLRTTTMGMQIMWQDLGVALAFNHNRTPQSDNQEVAQSATHVEMATEAAPTTEFDPLVDPTGNPIEPVNRDFALIVPSLGINATVIPGVNPVSRAGYLEALKKGVAHSSLSYYPNENGTVYLFSHSTNYEWFVEDLNAVFYHLKTIEPGQLVVIMYQGNRYTYQIREKKVISAKEISYLVPQTGVRTLILQTCWPPGTAYKRLLIFADLIDEKVYGKFKDVKV